MNEQDAAPRSASDPDPAILEQLLARIARQDPAALEALYRLVAPILLAVLMRMLRRRDVAEDVLQEVFLKVWQQAEQYDQRRGRSLAWLVSIARYRAIDVLRATKATVELGEDTVAATPQLQVAGPAEGADALNSGSALMRCLELIAAPQRRCIVLAYADGLTHEQISRTVGEPLGTVKSWVRRSLLSLRRCLGS
jgi:RNA polymerase sigma-70 factor (ECF subfamily)